ncbi:MAG TPA: pitrilysin family protein [Allosphingosinicella sp.]|uniref:M16 family metallopeptidase n=1 Tax=Allosphingosinicella sp. TaxID=2823234 RepID=UPI002EDAC952
MPKSKIRVLTLSALALGAAAIGLAAGTPAFAQTGATSQLSVPPIAFKERTLKNGLKVISLRDTTTPNVAVSVWYEVGSKHDPQGRSGFSHLFEHILSRKTRNMPYNMINRLTEDVGGVRNASNWYDRTNYYEIVPAQYLKTMLWTHAERMARPVVDPEVFETERNVVKEELRQRVLAPPYGRMRFVLSENSYDTLPHRRPGIGSIEDLDAATLEDARAFHEAYYGPDTAALIVSGNFDEAQLNRWVDEYFGSIPARANKIPLEIKGVEKPRTAPRSVVAYAPNVPLPVVGSTWRIPGTAHPDLPALAVMDAILTSGESSRLYKSLVYDKQLATSVIGELNDVEDGGYYAPYAIAASGKTLSKVDAALQAEIDRIRNERVTAAELNEAKNELIAASLREREIFSDRAFELGEAYVRTGDPRAADKRLAGIQKVTAADVQRVARKYLAPNARVDIRYLNETARPQGVADNWKNPVPMPTFASAPPAKRAPNTLAAEGEREQPPAPGAALPVTPPAISEGRLANGLQLVTAKTSDVPLATMALMVKGGASTDPRGKAGLANMAASLATKGTATRTAQQIAAEIESLGATLSSNAGPDGIILSVSAPTANLEAAGRILADIAQNATFPAAEVERERKQALDALSIAMKDPSALANMVAQPVLYGTAPYATPAAGTPGSLASMGQADLSGYYRQWFHPANAALIVSGGIDAARANALAQRLFAGWRGQGPAPVPPAERAGDAGKARTVVVDLPGAGQAAVVAAVRGVNRAHPDYYNLNVANAVLGAGSNGRLFQEVRVKRALSYGAYSNHPARADEALLTASAQTKNESAADVAKIFLDELDRLGKEPFEADAIEKRKAFLVGGINRQAESGGGFAALLGGLLQQGIAPAEAVRLTSAIQDVTPTAAAQAAGQIASSDRATLVIVGDASKFIDKLRALRPDVEVIKADELDLDAANLRKTG